MNAGNAAQLLAAKRAASENASSTNSLRLRDAAETGTRQQVNYGDVR